MSSETNTTAGVDAFPSDEELAELYAREFRPGDAKHLSDAAKRGLVRVRDRCIEWARETSIRSMKPVAPAPTLAPAVTEERFKANIDALADLIGEIARRVDNLKLNLGKMIEAHEKRMDLLERDEAEATKHGLDALEQLYAVRDRLTALEQRGKAGPDMPVAGEMERARALGFQSACEEIKRYALTVAGDDKSESEAYPWRNIAHHAAVLSERCGAPRRAPASAPERVTDTDVHVEAMITNLWHADWCGEKRRGYCTCGTAQVADQIRKLAPSPSTLRAEALEEAAKVCDEAARDSSEASASERALGFTVSAVAHSNYALAESLAAKAIRTLAATSPAKEAKPVKCYVCGAAQGIPRDRGWILCAACQASYEGATGTPAQAAQTNAEPMAFDLVAHMEGQRAFSLKTFGPGARTRGVVAHIRKELAEIEAEPASVEEWIDVVLLALDGAWRTGASSEQVAAALAAKQIKNQSRSWPDWRTLPADAPIEHDRAVPSQPRSETVCECGHLIAHHAFEIIKALPAVFGGSGIDWACGEGHCGCQRTRPRSSVEARAEETKVKE